MRKVTLQALPATGKFDQQSVNIAIITTQQDVARFEHLIDQLANFIAANLVAAGVFDNAPRRPKVFQGADPGEQRIDPRIHPPQPADILAMRVIAQVALDGELVGQQEQRQKQPGIGQHR